MYAFLLLLGAVVTAAGLGLVASGVSIQDHTYDATNVLPAMIAVIGGCILIGLSFVVRALQRVERALVARPMPRPARLGEHGSAAAPTTQPNEEARIPFPAKPKAASYIQPVPPAARSAPAAGKSAEASQESVPLVVDETDVSLLPKTPVRLDEESGDVDYSVSDRPSGSTQVKTAPRFSVAARPARRPLQPQDSMLNSLWPMAPAAASAPTPKVEVAPAVKVQVAAPAPALQSAGGSEPSPQAPPAAAQREAPAPVTILKSGVVEGMAYTLYSDGSIEAQLAGGMVRFGSITELRNHIEKSG
jgi:hypothetical protein